MWICRVNHAAGHRPAARHHARDTDQVIVKGKVDRVTTLPATAATLYPACAGKRQVNGKAALDRVHADKCEARRGGGDPGQNRRLLRS